MSSTIESKILLYGIRDKDPELFFNSHIYHGGTPAAIGNKAVGTFATFRAQDMSEICHPMDLYMMQSWNSIISMDRPYYELCNIIPKLESITLKKKAIYNKIKRQKHPWYSRFSSFYPDKNISFTYNQKNYISYLDKVTLEVSDYAHMKFIYESTNTMINLKLNLEELQLIDWEHIS